MPTFYNFTESGLVYSFDDVFVPADIFRDGNLWAWGNGIDGQLGNNVAFTNSDRSTPVTTFSGGTNWKEVILSDRYTTAAIKTDGTLWSWGKGDNGQLGNRTTASQILTPITTFVGGTNWKQVSVGEYHMAAVKTDGTLWLWGRASNGRLGNVAVSGDSFTPITTFAGGTNWKQIGCGESHTAAIKTDGTLWTWGAGSGGRLGNASTTDVSTPITTFAGGNNWKQVSGGGTHTVAIKTDGTLWTWGNGTYGRLGNGVTIGSISTPITTFAGGTNWKQVSSGGRHIVAIKTDGTLWTWGAGSGGRLGNASTTNVSTPVTTFAGGTNWKQVSGGYRHTAAIKTDGTLWVWGDGRYGALGNASTTDVSTPITTFVGGTNWKQVSCGYDYVAAVTYIDPVI